MFDKKKGSVDIIDFVKIILMKLPYKSDEIFFAIACSIEIFKEIETKVKNSKIFFKDFIFNITEVILFIKNYQNKDESNSLKNLL